MADKNPFGGLGLGQMGSERSFMYQGGPISDALKGIKTGLGVMALEKSGLAGFLNNTFGVSRDEKTGAYGYKKPEGSVPPMQSVSPGVPATPAQSASEQSQPSSVNKQLDDEWGPDEQESSFTPRNPALDQLPQQFAQGPVAPPMGQIPQAQIPQSSGIGKALLATFV